MNYGQTAVDEQLGAFTNLVCMSCGHIQPVRRDELPCCCENCHQRFTVQGYLLDDTTDAEELSQEVLENKAISRITGDRL